MKLPLNRTAITAALVVALSGASAARAEVQLPSILGDNMVLQRDTQAAIWGWDAPNTDVEVSFRGRKYLQKAAADGKGMARVATGASGVGFPLEIKGSNMVALQNVAVGEVWPASGQSNMWWHVSNSKNAGEEAKNGDHPTVRIWDATINSPAQGGFRAQTPQRTVNAAWKSATPQSVPDFPGVPYFFARDL